MKPLFLILSLVCCSAALSQAAVVLVNFGANATGPAEYNLYTSFTAGTKSLYDVNGQATSYTMTAYRSGGVGGVDATATAA